MVLIIAALVKNVRKTLEERLQTADEPIFVGTIVAQRNLAHPLLCEREVKHALANERVLYISTQEDTEENYTGGGGVAVRLLSTIALINI